jgi:hypothetical protein
MSETEPSVQQPDSGFKGCLPLLVPFITVIVLIILILAGFIIWGKLSR